MYLLKSVSEIGDRLSIVYTLSSKFTLCMHPLRSRQLSSIRVKFNVGFYFMMLRYCYINLFNHRAVFISTGVV